MARRSGDPSYYPAFINLKGKRCAVVGGGKIAERKILSLLRSGARVKVISPVITGILDKYKEKGAIGHIKRNYKKGDLKNMFLVIAATSCDRVNEQVAGEAPCLVNVVDSPEMANFIVPSVIRRGPLAVAVSTSGASPAAAKAIRKELKIMYGKDFGIFLDFLKGLRKKASKEIKDKHAREVFLKGIASKEIFVMLRQKGFKATKRKVVTKFEQAKGWKSHRGSVNA